MDVDAGDSETAFSRSRLGVGASWGVERDYQLEHEIHTRNGQSIMVDMS